MAVILVIKDLDILRIVNFRSLKEDDLVYSTPLLPYFKTTWVGQKIMEVFKDYGIFIYLTILKNVVSQMIKANELFLCTDLKTK